MWHEARRSEKKVHDMMDAARKRAQRRAIYLAKRRGDPQQSIQAIGSRCRIYRDDALYQATEDQQGMYDLIFMFLFFRSSNSRASPLLTLNFIISGIVFEMLQYGKFHTFGMQEPTSTIQ